MAVGKSSVIREGAHLLWRQQRVLWWLYGINLLLAGHYATETFGVKALAAHVAKKFQLDWEFISLPTGL